MRVLFLLFCISFVTFPAWCQEEESAEDILAEEEMNEDEAAAIVEDEEESAMTKPDAAPPVDDEGDDFSMDMDGTDLDAAPPEPDKSEGGDKNKEEKEEPLKTSLPDEDDPLYLKAKKDKDEKDEGKEKNNEEKKPLTLETFSKRGPSDFDLLKYTDEEIKDMEELALEAPATIKVLQMTLRHLQRQVNAKLQDFTGANRAKLKEEIFRMNEAFHEVGRQLESLSYVYEKTFSPEMIASETRSIEQSKDQSVDIISKLRRLIAQTKDKVTQMRDMKPPEGEESPQPHAQEIEVNGTEEKDGESNKESI